MERKGEWKKPGFSRIVLAVTAVLALGTHAGFTAEVCIDFEGLAVPANGGFVEGPGTVHPLLDISDAIIGDNLILIQEGTEPKAYTGGQDGINLCLDEDNEPGHGFGNAEGNATEDLEFTFDSGIAVTSFSIDMIDYGDNFPFFLGFETTHIVRLIAYDSNDTVLDVDELTFTSTDNGTKMTTLNGEVITDEVLLETAGDACLADTGQPGHWTLSVSAEAIARVELQFVDNYSADPVIFSTEGDISFDDICFTYDGGAGGEPLTVDIDIKPGSDLNPVNPGSNGLIPVAILTTDDFDAATVDAASVILAGADVAVRGKAEKLMARMEDVDGDGDLDLMLQVDIQSAGAEWTTGTVTLTGQTDDGRTIEGADDVIVVPPEC